MNIEPVVFAQLPREIGEERLHRPAQPAARPVDGARGVLVHAQVKPRDRLVVIAHDDPGPLRHLIHDPPHHPFRLGAIADEVAEIDDAVDAQRPDLAETRLERQVAAVAVADERDQHGDTSRPDPPREH